jgi:plasmid stability protein
VNSVNLYRIMTDVRAGAHQRSLTKGVRGIVTLWVRAESQGIALARAEIVLTNKRYASIGRLQSYAEALDNDPLASATEEERAADRREDSVLAGYDALKEQALAHADGLHEVWLDAPVRQQKIA